MKSEYVGNALLICGVLILRLNRSQWCGGRAYAS